MKLGKIGEIGIGGGQGEISYFVARGGSSDIQAAGGAMGEPHSGPLRFEREQPVRLVLLAALVLRVGGCDAVAFDWSGEAAWVSCPYWMIARVWRKLL